MESAEGTLEAPVGCVLLVRRASVCVCTLHLTSLHARTWTLLRELWKLWKLLWAVFSSWSAGHLCVLWLDALGMDQRSSGGPVLKPSLLLTIEQEAYIIRPHAHELRTLS